MVPMGTFHSSVRESRLLWEGVLKTATKL